MSDDDDLDALLDSAIQTMDQQDKELEAESRAREAAVAQLVAEQESAARHSQQPTGDEAKLLEAVQALMSILSKGPEALEKAPDDEMRRVQEVLANTLETMKSSGDVSEAEHAQIAQCSEMLRKIEKSEHTSAPPTAEEVAEMQKLIASMSQLSNEQLAAGTAGPAAASSSSEAAAGGSAQGEMTDEMMAEHLKRIAELHQEAVGGSGGGGPSITDQQLGDLLANLLKPESIVGPFRSMAKAYPLWFEKHASSVPADDLLKFQQQHVKMVEVCELLDEGSLDAALKPEATEHDRERLSKFSVLLEELHSFGAPPESLHELIAELSKS